MGRKPKDTVVPARPALRSADRQAAPPGDPGSAGASPSPGEPPEATPEPATLTVDPHLGGARADLFLHHKIPRLSRSRAARIISHGDLRRPNGTPLRPASRVVAGEPLTLWRVPPDQEPSNLTLSILWQDDHLVVFDKPPGIAVHPSARYYRSTLTQLLRRWHFPPSPAPDAVRLPRPAHRLDRETSGVLLCCRTTSSERTWKARFLSARVHKTYLALCQGVPPWSSTTITIPLAVRPHSVVRIKVGPTDHGLPATTHVRVAWSGKDRSLLVCHPQTGRTHQIRAHLSLAGFPVVGDKLYGPLGDDWFARYADHGLAHDAAAQLGHTRHALHAAVLAGEDHSFVAPWPADLAALSPEAAAAAQDLLQEHAATASLAPRSWGRPTR